jgi:hypothetical protein
MLSKVNKPFLEKVLNEPIAEFTISKGSNAGDNVAGSLHSIKVTTTKGSTVKLVLKSVADDPQQQGYASQFGIFSVENAMYDYVCPQIEKLMETKGLKNEGLPVPRYYGGNHGTPQAAEDYLLLEDVRPEGFTMPNKFKSLTLPQVNFIMKELAKFHAKTYFWLKYEGEKVFDENEGIKKFRDSLFSQENPEMKMGWGSYLTKQVQNAVIVLKEQKEDDLAERVQKRCIGTEPFAAYEIVRKPARLLEEDKGFPCIIHGDCWGNNIMIKHDSNGNPVELKFLDFQQTRRGNIFEDLGYFFMCSTCPEFRKNNLLQCLNVYYESFKATCDKLGTSLPIGFTRGSLIDTVYEIRLANFTHSFFAIPMQLGEPTPTPTKEEGNMKNGETNGTQEQEQAGPPEGFDPSKLSPEQMMAIMEQQMEARSKEHLVQLRKSPIAIQRLLDITKEAATAGLI